METLKQVEYIDILNSSPITLEIIYVIHKIPFLFVAMVGYSPLSYFWNIVRRSTFFSKSSKFVTHFSIIWCFPGDVNTSSPDSSMDVFPCFKIFEIECTLTLQALAGEMFT